MFAGFMRSPEATFPGALSLVLMIRMPMNPGKAIAQQLGPGAGGGGGAHISPSPWGHPLPAGASQPEAPGCESPISFSLE